MESLCLLVTVVLVCGLESFVRMFMLAAHDHGMTEGDYVFIYLGILPRDSLLKPWLRYDDDDHKAKLAYFPLLQVRWKGAYFNLRTQDDWVPI